MVGTFWVSCFFYSCYIHLLKSLYYFPIGSLLWLSFFDNTHGLSFHFYLYSVKEENTLHLEILNFFFVLCLLQFCCIIPNVCKSLSLMVVRSNAEPKLFKCVIKLHQSIFPFVRNMFHSNSKWVPMSNPIFLWRDHTRLVIKRVSIAIKGKESKERKKNGGWGEVKNIVVTERFSIATIAWWLNLVTI